MPRWMRCIVALLLVVPPLLAQERLGSWGFFESNGTRLFYEVAGAGEPVILIHGGWLNSRQWDAQMPVLSRDYRVIRYDFRGAGRSPLGDSAFSHADDLAALLRHLQLDRVHIVGLSAGSQIALDFALTHPQSTASLMIGASPLAGFEMDTAFTNGMRGVIAAGVADDLQLTHDRMWAFAPFRVAAGMPAVRATLNSLILHDNTWAPNRPNAARPRPRPTPPAQRLGEISAPVLVVVGDGEMPALVREAEFVAERIPGAELLRISGAGHFPNLEQPQRYNEIVLRWLRRVR